MGKTLSVWSIILSVLFFVPLSSIIGLILGIVSYRREKKGTEEDRNLAMVGIILGAIFIVPNLMFTFLLLMWFVVIFAAMAGAV